MAWSRLEAAGFRTCIVSNTDRDDIYHVAAGLRVDLAAARDLGFRAAWVDRHTGEAPLPDPSPDLAAASLDGVMDAFAAQGWMES